MFNRTLKGMIVFLCVIVLVSPFFDDDEPITPIANEILMLEQE